jgi:hypothetical protein
VNVACAGLVRIPSAVQEFLHNPQVCRQARIRSRQERERENIQWCNSCGKVSKYENLCQFLRGDGFIDLSLPNIISFALLPYI